MSVIDIFKDRLLDTSARNQLINLNKDKRNLSIQVDNKSLLLEKLLSNKKLNLFDIDKYKKNYSELHNITLNEDNVNELYSIVNNNIATNEVLAVHNNLDTNYILKILNKKNTEFIKEK
ncbi:MAG: DUF4011 domain-containing protein, partial [Anaeroplasmataceae bacterium]